MANNTSSVKSGAMPKAIIAERRSFIGGSDARIIMGNDEAKLVRLWRQKRGEAEPENLSLDLIVQLGTITEGLNRTWYERSTGHAVEDIQRRVRHPIHEWMGATLDGRVQQTGAVFEAKFMLPWNFSEEAAADKHMSQLQHNMWVIQARTAVLSIITGGGKWVEIEVNADALYQHLLLTAERKFWRCVQTGETPRLFGIEPPKPRLEAVRAIAAKGGERTFRYASLASGLDIVRKCLGKHEIAVMQTTAVEQGQITLTTLLVHASGEWVSSLWPVCPAGEPSAQVKGTALTYARRYALFALVGIAGEDDLDAPEFIGDPHSQCSSETAKAQSRAKGNLHSPRPTALDPDNSAEVRDGMLQELSTYETEDALAVWAYRSLPLKNTLRKEDAETVEAAYLSKLQSFHHSAITQGQNSDIAPVADSDDLVAPIEKHVRKRSKAHLSFVASQPCLICKTAPCDAHHLKIARPRSLGRKVSDEFTVPLCRKHHQELHRHGNEANWWANLQVTPVPIAKELWDVSPAHTGRGDPKTTIPKPSIIEAPGPKL